MSFKMASISQNAIRIIAGPSRSFSAPKSLRVSRSFSSTSSYRAEPALAASTSTPPPPPPTNASPKVSKIVDEIATLTLLEAADLVEALKNRLNIVEIAMPSSSAAPAAPAAAPAEEVAAAPKEKTVFNVNLKAIDATQKAKAIREVKAIMPNMNLVEAKKFVESLPKVLKENATKEESEKLKKAFEAIGAEVTLD